MARTALPRSLDYFWEGRLVRFLGVPPWGAAVIVTLVVAATYFVPGYGLGLLPIELELRDSNIPLDPYSYAAIITSMLAGFTVFALPFGHIRHQENIVLLEPVIPSLDRAGLRQLYDTQTQGNARRRTVVIAIGWGLGLLFPLLTVPGALTLLTGLDDLWETNLPPAAYVAAGWFLIVVPVLISSLAKASYLMVSDVRQVLADVERRIVVGPLDADALRPLASAGLHTSFVWMIGAALGGFFVINANIPPYAIWVMIGGIALLGGLAAVAPARAGRRILRRAKSAALADVRAAIARQHRDVLDPAKPDNADDDTGLMKLGALLAYEQRLETARETPIDMPAIAQFTLYLAIPVGSWLGGAFVERMVDAALG
ncbi:hypothetical protein [Pyruvatibacter sp.]|uniref:hypothetical protein n=1 Tax=Pyruvatibacter sp. TaxID=1981328 RepID=UPI0032EB5734